MRDLWDFLLAVLSQWVALMSGIASVIIGLWLRAKKTQDIGSKAFFFVGLACMLLAFFLAWRDEHKSKLALMDFGLPKLSGSIDQAAVLKLPEGFTGIILWVTIRNLGAPSTVDSYRLESCTTDGSRINLPLEAAPQNVVFGDMGKAKTMDTSHGAIYDKTAEQPIPRGGASRGMVFSRTDLPLADKFVLKFNDVTGKTISITNAGTTGSGYNTLPKHLPGTPDAN
jgi:hypothetical protein